MNTENLIMDICQIFTDHLEEKFVHYPEDDTRKHFCLDAPSYVMNISNSLLRESSPDALKKKLIRWLNNAEIEQNYIYRVSSEGGFQKMGIISK